MTNIRTIGYVPIISTGYLVPIFSLFELMDMQSLGTPSEVQSSSVENSFSASIIILTVTMLESAIRRFQHWKQNTDARNALKFLKTQFPNLSCHTKIEEVFVVRDVLVHNHLWIAKTFWDANAELKFTEIARDENFGDDKFHQNVNLDTRTTKILRLNIFPTRISRSDALTVLETTIDLFYEMEEIDRNLIYISIEYVSYNKKEYFLKDAIKMLKSV